MTKPGEFIERPSIVVLGGIVPHPPIMIPPVGGDDARRVQRTADALCELGRRICRSGAEALVIISPHGPVFWEAVGVVTAGHVTGDFGQFRAPTVSFSLDTDVVLAGALREELAALGMPEKGIGERQGYRLDHGVTAPLYWLQKGGVELPVVLAGVALLPLHRLYGFGVAVQRAARSVGRKVAVIASGDLSHRLTPGAPNGYDPNGAVFDQRVQDAVAAADPLALINLDQGLIEHAGECGLRPIVMLFGAFDGYAVRAEVLSYEGPFGVGYMVASLAPQGEDSSRQLGETVSQAVTAQRAEESFLVRTAREAIETYLVHGDRLAISAVPAEFSRQAGCFVSLKKGGLLRGCIGTIGPTQPNIVAEVVANAISAATRDSRFDPVGLVEVADLRISVDVLGPPELIDGIADLDPKRYGVIVNRGSRRGLLLPDLDGIETAEQQVTIARQKAGISPDLPVEMERFVVVRYH